MKIRLVPVAAGLAAATGIALTGASLASADVTSPTSTVAAYGQVAPPKSDTSGADCPGEGVGQPRPTGTESGGAAA
jgi:hypothetical protein